MIRYKTSLTAMRSLIPYSSLPGIQLILSDLMRFSGIFPIPSEVKNWKHNRFRLNPFNIAMLEYLIKDMKLAPRSFSEKPFQFN